MKTLNELTEARQACIDEAKKIPFPKYLDDLSIEEYVREAMREGLMKAADDLGIIIQGIMEDGPTLWDGD